MLKYKHFRFKKSQKHPKFNSNTVTTLSLIEYWRSVPLSKRVGHLIKTTFHLILVSLKIKFLRIIPHSPREKTAGMHV